MGSKLAEGEVVLMVLAGMFNFLTVSTLLISCLIPSATGLELQHLDLATE